MCDFQLEPGYLHILLRFWTLYKLPLSVGFLWHHASRKWGLLPCYCQVSTSAGAPLALYWHLRVGHCFLLLGGCGSSSDSADNTGQDTAVRDESPHSLLGLLWLHPGSTLGTSLQPCKGGSPSSPHGLCSCRWGWGYSFSYDVWVEYSAFCLKMFCLSRLFLFWSFI